MDTNRKPGPTLVANYRLVTERVPVDGILGIENVWLADDIINGFTRQHIIDALIPTGFKPNWVPGDIYNAYVGGLEEGGLERKCVDVQLVTQTPEGQWVVIFAVRGETNSFPRRKWMGGGANYKGQSEADWAVRKACKEFGIDPATASNPVLIGGPYRTSWIWFATGVWNFTSTTQTCYVAKVPWEAYIAGKADQDHKDIGHRTLQELLEVKDEDFDCQNGTEHWYPYRMQLLVLLCLAGKGEEAVEMMKNPSLQTGLS